MILAMCWVPKGAAQAVPTVYRASEEELRDVASAHHPEKEGEEEEHDLEGTRVERHGKDKADDEDEISKKYNLDSYDDEGGGTQNLLAGARPRRCSIEASLLIDVNGWVSGVLGVAEDVVFPNNDNDPYITVRDVRVTDME